MLFKRDLIHVLLMFLKVPEGHPDTINVNAHVLPFVFWIRTRNRRREFTLACCVIILVHLENKINNDAIE